MNRDQILKDYQQGDTDQRASLFLYFRELRDAFMQIEQDEPEERAVSCCA